MTDRLWIWRAWTANRERIADCGTGWHPDADSARRGAYMCLGGPYMSDVVEMQVEEVDFDRVTNAKKRTMAEALRAISEVASDTKKLRDGSPNKLATILKIAQDALAFQESVSSGKT